MLRLIDRYLARELLTSALFAVCTLSFVLVLGQIFKRLFEFMVDHNVPATYIITFIAYFLPVSLILSIPWGFLTAVLLVFGRLSGGNELTALRTAGISIPRIARPVLLVAVAFSGLCLWINLYVAPVAQQSLKDAFFQVATNNPAAVFDADRPIDDFPGKRIFIGNTEGNHLENIHVFDLDANNKPVRVLYAQRGSLETDLPHRQIKMRLENSRFEQRDYTQPDDLTKIKGGTLGEWVYPISLEELYIKKQGRRRVESFTYEELRDDLSKKRRRLREDKTKLDETHDERLKKAVRNDLEAVAAAATELNKRFSFSMACLTFALIGIPLGITAHRQETSAGFGLSLLVAFTYFLIIIVVNTIRSKASMHPELLIWLPNVIFPLSGRSAFLPFEPPLTSSRRGGSWSDAWLANGLQEWLQTVHQLSERLEIHLLLAVAEGFRRIRMNFDDQPIRAQCHRTGTECRDKVRSPAPLARIDDDWQVTFQFRGGYGGEIERIARVGLESAYPALAQHDVGVATAQDVFRAQEPFLDSLAQSAFEQNRLSGLGRRHQEAEVL